MAPTFDAASTTSSDLANIDLTTLKTELSNNWTNGSSSGACKIDGFVNLNKCASFEVKASTGTFLEACLKRFHLVVSTVYLQYAYLKC